MSEWLRYPLGLSLFYLIGDVIDRAFRNHLIGYWAVWGELARREFIR